MQNWCVCATRNSAERVLFKNTPKTFLPRFCSVETGDVSSVVTVDQSVQNSVLTWSVVFTIFTADHYHSQSNYTYTTPNNVSESKKHLRNSESCTKQHQRTFGTHKTVHALEEMSQSCRLQNVLIVQNISDSSPMLVKCTLKSLFI